MLTLSACGGSDSKDPLTGNKGAVPSSTPAPVVAPMPDAALKHTDDGALAFVQFYFGTILNEAYAQGDVKRLVSVSDPNCVVCRESHRSEQAWGRPHGQVGYQPHRCPAPIPGTPAP